MRLPPPPSSWLDGLMISAGMELDDPSWELAKLIDGLMISTGMELDDPSWEFINQI
ncbi:hypothetical protein TIFTF001_025330 [Ficus carica]|uniref:Uncharacterized protein n=1 Tax=Ficus carica TaxID=3494 RepID=A0AA88DGK2_FICCA|nr:hypothetical protein TIFTF001_025330 [Ficus carica]